MAGFVRAVGRGCAGSWPSHSRSIAARSESAEMLVPQLSHQRQSVSGDWGGNAHSAWVRFSSLTSKLDSSGA
ncbi:MAG: hypothetical protein MUC60_19640 [Oscillatoria sp. Prado101]|nr:hypothetical protein [Oscillatoria sp. Prado101]